MSETHLDFAGCSGNVEGLGPGKRTAMWVRGCSLACAGCMTPELWQNGPAVQLSPIEQVAGLLRPLLRNADGLTISGGEPMEQPLALTRLVQLLRMDYPDLEVLVYSGYRLENLSTSDPQTRGFLREIDILIDQPFDQSASNVLKWRGSDNQRIHYLSARAQKHLAEEDAMPLERPLQIQTLASGQFRLVGIPARGDMARYRALMEERGLSVRKVKRFDGSQE